MVSQAQFIHYKTGHEAFDIAHYELLVLIDDIIIACTRQHPDVVTQLIRLRVTLVDHIADEEHEMLDTNYPYRLPHIANHTAMLRSLDKLIRTDGGHDYMLFKLALSDFSRLMLSHIDHYDIQFVTWVDAQQSKLDIVVE